MKCCTLPDGESKVGKGKGDGRRKHRGKVKHCSKKQWAKMPQICAGKPPRKHRK